VLIFGRMARAIVPGRDARMRSAVVALLALCGSAARGPRRPTP
jgi:hypothetical protein